MKVQPARPDIAGIRQVARSIQSGTAARVYLAGDAREDLIAPLRRAAAEAEIPVTEVETMAELGRLCRIQVGTAAAALTREREEQ